MEATGQFHRKFDREFFADGFFAAASEKARECAFDVGRKLGKARFYAVGSGLIEGGIWRRLFGLGFGGLGRRGNGQNLLNGVPEFDAVQSQIFSACHAHTKAQVKTNC
jgi:hypothetical protein